jgi:hypothetical protein
MMDIFRNSQGIILKPGGLASEESCCCEIECTETGASSGGQGVTIDYYPFPLDQQEIFFTWQAYTVPDKFTVSACGTVLFTTGEPISGGGERCLTKPAGCGEIEIRVDGNPGTAWDYGFDCKCPPPPPPTPCCTLFTRCEDLDILKCSGTERSCCRSTFPDSDCSGDDPPIIECDKDEAELATIPSQKPFDCLGRTDQYFRFGAFISVRQWSAVAHTGYTGDPAWLSTFLSYMTGLMNQNFYAEWRGCFADNDDNDPDTGTPGTHYDLGPGPTVFDAIDGLGEIDSTWRAQVTLNMCERFAEVRISADSTNTQLLTDFITGVAFIYLEPVGGSERTAVCNSYTGCFCREFSGPIEGGGGGNMNAGLTFLQT